jgi:hypothetical protein
MTFPITFETEQLRVETTARLRNLEPDATLRRKRYTVKEKKRAIAASLGESTFP